MVHKCENVDCRLPFYRLTKKEKYCHRCRKSGAAYYKPAPTLEKECPGCGESFKTSHSKKIYCSQICRETADTRGNPEVTKKCKYCGKGFRTSDTRRTYCGDPCYRAAKALRSKNGTNHNKV